MCLNSAPWEGKVILWDFRSFQPLRRFEGLGKASEYPLFVDGRPCVLVSEERRLTLQTLETSETVRALQFDEEISLSSFSFMSNGQRALSMIVRRDRRPSRFGTLNHHYFFVVGRVTCSRSTVRNSFGVSRSWRSSAVTMILNWLI